FIANNGATITGTVSPAGGTPFASFSRSSTRASQLSAVPTVTRRLSPNHIVVGFKNDALGVAAAASVTYRSMAAARQSMARIQQSVASLAKAQPISHAEISPSILAARLQVDDASQVEAVMAALRSSADV